MKASCVTCGDQFDYFTDEPPGTPLCFYCINPSFLRIGSTDLLDENQKKFIRELNAKVQEFSMIEMSERQKVAVAQEVQISVDWIRFRAGVDKECFECRTKNSPESDKCVKCGQIFICEACKGSEKKRSWRCSHAAGFKAREVIRMAYRSREEEKAEKREYKDKEPRFPKRERVSLFEEE